MRAKRSIVVARVVGGSRALVRLVSTLALLRAGYTHPPERPAPKVNDGVLEVSGRDFERDGPVTLAADWEIFPEGALEGEAVRSAPPSGDSSCRLPTAPCAVAPSRRSAPSPPPRVTPSFIGSSRSSTRSASAAPATDVSPRRSWAHACEGCCATPFAAWSRFSERTRATWSFWVAARWRSTRAHEAWRSGPRRTSTAFRRRCRGCYPCLGFLDGLLAGAHPIDKAQVADRKVLLFDDLYRSGATMNAIAFCRVRKEDAQLRELFDKVAEMGRAQTEAVTKVEAALVALKDAIEDLHDNAA